MLGRAAVALWYDVPPEAKDEWEDWHTHEHMPERVSVPGFLRGTRWQAFSGDGYFGLYEAARLGTLTSGPYIERLNNPTPWSRKMMPHHHNMVRSVCRVRASVGTGLSAFIATVRFSPAQRRRGAIMKSLAEKMTGIPARRGFSGAHLLQSQPKPETAEERIRGGDASADCVLLVNGYDADIVRIFVEREIAPQLAGATCGFYRLGFVLSGKPDRLR